MILVTGATGLLGGHLLHELLRTEQTVRATYRSSSAFDTVKKIIGYYEDDEDAFYNRIEWVEADILDVISLRDALKGVSKVYHCAAIVSFNPTMAKSMMEVNAVGTANVVNACLAENMEKLVYVSSVAAIGRPAQHALISENTEWVPSKHNSAYAKSKYKAELEVWRGQQEGLNTVIVNPSIILGPGNWQEGSAALIKKIADGFDYYTLGTNGFVDVRDVADCMVQLMESNISNERFLLVAENLSYKKVFEFIADGIGIEPPKKEAKRWQAALLWRAEWLRTKLFGGSPVITKETAHAAQSTFYYENQKVKEALNFSFRPMEKSIKQICGLYQNDINQD